MSGTYDVWKNDASQIYLFYWDPSSNNEYRYSMWFNDEKQFNQVYYDVSLSTANKGCSIIKNMKPHPITDISFNISRNFTNFSQNSAGGFGQALSLYYGNYTETTNTLYYTNNKMKNIGPNQNIKFSDVKCDKNYSSNPKTYRLFRSWINKTTNTIIFYRASNTYKSGVNYSYELVFARNCIIKPGDISVNYYIDFICVQPTLSTNVFTLTFDAMLKQFNNLSNLWYWTANTPPPLTYKILYNSQLFRLSGGDDSEYRRKNTNQNINFKFLSSTLLNYTHLALQFTEWVECYSIIINTVSCEGIKALSYSFSKDCSINATDSQGFPKQCSNFNNFPLLQSVKSDFITNYTKTTQFESNYNFSKYSSDKSDETTYYMVNNSNIYLKFVDINTFDISNNKTLISTSGKTNINYFELKRYLTNDFNTISDELNTHINPNSSLLVLYDTTPLNNPPKKLDNFPKIPPNSSVLDNFTKITQPDFNNVTKMKFSKNSIPNFYQGTDVSDILENRYAVAWAVVNTIQKKRILYSEIDVDISLHFISSNGQWNNQSINFNTIANKNPTEALMNWYDTSSYNYQYKLDMCNNINNLTIRWPGKLVRNEYTCNSLYNNYYNNLNTLKTIDNLFKSNLNEAKDLTINNIWYMKSFKEDPGKNSYTVNGISGQLTNMNPLYLTHTNNIFLICQLYNKYLYPLVVYASGTCLQDVMYANHSLSSSDALYKWFISGPEKDNNFTPFSYKNNIGSVISWFIGTTSFEDMKSLFKYKKYEIFNDQIIKMSDTINNISLLGFLDTHVI